MLLSFFVRCLVFQFFLTRLCDVRLVRFLPHIFYNNAYLLLCNQNTTRTILFFATSPCSYYLTNIDDCKHFG